MTHSFPTRGSSDLLGEKDVEYGVVRLIHLGVVSGYLKDYNRRIFRVDVTNEWLQIHRMPAALAEYLAENFAGFMRRYHLVGGAEQVNLIRSESISLAGLYGTVSQQMMAFVYQQIERQRSEARRVGKECVSTCRSRLSP